MKPYYFCNHHIGSFYLFNGRDVFVTNETSHLGNERGDSRISSCQKIAYLAYPSKITQNKRWSFQQRAFHLPWITKLIFDDSDALLINVSNSWKPIGTGTVWRRVQKDPVLIRRFKKVRALQKANAFAAGTSLLIMAGIGVSAAHKKMRPYKNNDALSKSGFKSTELPNNMNKEHATGATEPTEYPQVALFEKKQINDRTQSNHVHTRPNPNKDFQQKVKRDLSEDNYNQVLMLKQDIEKSLDTGDLNKFHFDFVDISKKIDRIPDHHPEKKTLQEYVTDIEAKSEKIREEKEKILKIMKLKDEVNEKLDKGFESREIFLHERDMKSMLNLINQIPNQRTEKDALVKYYTDTQGRLERRKVIRKLLDGAIKKKRDVDSAVRWVQDCIGLLDDEEKISESDIADFIDIYQSEHVTYASAIASMNSKIMELSKYSAGDYLGYFEVEQIQILKRHIVETREKMEKIEKYVNEKLTELRDRVKPTK